MPYIGKKPADIIATAVDTTTGTFSGAVSASSVDADGGVTVDNITIDGTEIDLSSGDLTIDVAGDIILDADGGDFIFKDGGSGDEANKVIRFSTPSHDTDEENVQILQVENEGAFNQISFGGGTSALNASTKLRFLTAAVDTTTGVERISVDSSGNIVFNETGVDANFRVESNTNGNMLFVDAGNDRIGINQGTPLQPLHMTDADFAFARFQTTAVSRTGIDFGQHQDGTGHINLRDSDDIKISTADTERLRITSAGRFSTGAEASPDALPGGITLHGAALSNGKMITFKQSNTAHGMTSLAETDTQGAIGGLGDDGGLYIQGYSEQAAAVYITGHTGSGNTAKNTGGQAAVRAQGRNKSGTSVGALADHNIFGVYDNSANAKVLIDEDGDIFHDGSVTAYDSYDDAQLVRAFDRTMAIKDIIHSKFDKFVKYNRKHLEEAGLLGTCTPEEKAEGHRSMISLTGMQQLHNGAIWQQYEKHEKLASAFYKLAKKTIGVEEADKLLTQEEIQLLN